MSIASLECVCCVFRPFLIDPSSYGIRNVVPKVCPECPMVPLRAPLRHYIWKIGFKHGCKNTGTMPLCLNLKFFSPFFFGLDVKALAQRPCAQTTGPPLCVARFSSLRGLGFLTFVVWLSSREHKSACLAPLRWLQFQSINRVSFSLFSPFFPPLLRPPFSTLAFPLFFQTFPASPRPSPSQTQPLIVVGLEVGNPKRLSLGLLEVKDMIFLPSLALFVSIWVVSCVVISFIYFSHLDLSVKSYYSLE